MRGRGEQELIVFATVQCLGHGDAGIDWEVCGAYFGGDTRLLAQMSKIG